MSRRLPTGGSRIDRSRPITLTVDGQEVAAYQGDTVASAMLAADLPVLARGIYTGRPRGVGGLDSEESSAFVQVLTGGGEPMVPATTLEVCDGLAVQRLAGRGWLPPERDDTRYDLSHQHCEVAVVGGGIAGLRATLEAAAEGGRVLVCDDGPVLGGRADLVPTSAAAEATELVARLAEHRGVRVLTRSTVIGSYGHGRLAAVEKRWDHVDPAEAPTGSRRRLHHIQADRVVLATGSQERPIAFADNDRPGIMLAGAAAGYAARYGVLAGDRAVVWTAHDGGLWAALDLVDAGAEVVAVLDVRERLAPQPAAGLRARGVEVHTGAQVTGTDGDTASGSGRLRQVHTTAGSFEVDLLAVSGGRNPALALLSHPGGRTRWSAEVAGFVADVSAPTLRDRETVVGAASGDPGWAPCGRVTRTPPAAFFCAATDRPEDVFLDPHRDATLADLHRAHAAGLTSVEHVKRFTTIGTGADQARSHGILTVGVLAQVLGAPVGEVGTTSARPPTVPVPFAVLAGRARGALSDPVRVSAVHERVRAAPMEDVGQWKRPRFFPAPGEGMDEAVAREVQAVRTAVGTMDASTLGKIDLRGPDVGVLLDQVYTNLMSSLAVGRARYGVMCGADGMVVDDGTVTRLAPDHWLLTTTTGNAAEVLDALEEWLQTEWTELDVSLTSVTDHWSVVALAGPLSRDVMTTLAPQEDWSVEAFGFMRCREAQLAQMPARITRISFSGELAFELAVPSWCGVALWDAVRAAGEPHGITPYGTETMHVLRAEKGYPIVGQETDGTVTPHDLGLAWAVSRRKRDFVGCRSLQRPEGQRPDRRQLVGLVPLDGSTGIVEGSQLVERGADLTAPPVPMVGHVTSAYPTGHTGRPFALALLTGGRDRVGDVLDAVDDRVPVAVRVTGPVHYDPEGARRDG